MKILMVMSMNNEHFLRFTGEDVLDMIISFYKISEKCKNLSGLCISF